MTAAEQLATAAAYRLAARTLSRELDGEALQDLRRMNRFLPHHPADPSAEDVLTLDENEALLETSAEFWRLFTGPHPLVRPVPHLRSGISRQDGRALKAALERHGFRVRACGPLPEDHVAVWLAVIADLHLAAAFAPSSRDAWQISQAFREVTRSPITCWLELTLATVATTAHTWPYRPVARAALAALAATRSIGGLR